MSLLGAEEPSWSRVLHIMSISGIGGATVELVCKLTLSSESRTKLGHDMRREVK